MPIDYQKLKHWPFTDLTHAYTAKDCMLYALGLGLGADPLDMQQLRFVYEKDLQVLPTMAVVLASPGFWLQQPGTGVNWKAVLHGEQGLTIHRPLRASGTLIGTSITRLAPSRRNTLCGAMASSIRASPCPPRP